MKPETPNQSAPDSKLNTACFLLPILATFLPVFVNEGASGLPSLLTEVVSGILGLGGCIGVFLAAYILIFRPSRKTKQAAWSYLFGCALAIIAFVWVANWINAG